MVEETRALLDTWVNYGNVILPEAKKPVSKRDLSSGLMHLSPDGTSSYKRLLGTRHLVKKMLKEEALELPQNKDVL
ncbi:hypothetical protein U1Q18_025299 [Sarracenia purpurea var. burkii]